MHGENYGKFKTYIEDVIAKLRDERTLDDGDFRHLEDFLTRESGNETEMLGQKEAQRLLPIVLHLFEEKNDWLPEARRTLVEDRV